MLAQQWLNANHNETPYDRILRSYLDLPTKLTPLLSLFKLGQLAERIVYTDDVPTLLYTMHHNRQLTLSGVAASAKLPFSSFWLEYRTRMGGKYMPILMPGASPWTDYGALVTECTGGRVKMLLVAGFERDGRYHSNIVAVVEFMTWPPVPIRVPDKASSKSREGLEYKIEWVANRDDWEKNLDTSIEELGGMLIEMIFGIFLVTQPRVYDEEIVKFNEKKQARRAKAGKLPLLSYRKIRLNIITPKTRYVRANGGDVRPLDLRDQGDTESADAVHHRRYHKVMGHFRHYQNGHTVWIAPHYRGDPSLGVTFTERDVVR